MSYYRLYFGGTGADGRFTGVEELDAKDDVEALRLAERFAGDRSMELWCGTRKVRSFAVQNANRAATPLLS